MDLSDIKRRLQHGQTTFNATEVLNLIGEIDRLKQDAQRADLLDGRIAKVMEILDPMDDDDFEQDK